MFKDVMVDLETSGTSPDRTAIIQLSAVKFDIETGAVCADDMFDECLFIPPWRYWDDSTRKWWAGQPRHVLEGIFSRMRDPGAVMREFVEWAAPTNSLRLWAKPVSFEFPFLASYCRDYELTMPFDFRQAMDLRSWMRGITNGLPAFDESTVQFEGDQHNAIFDVLHQIKIAFATKEYAKHA